MTFIKSQTHKDPYQSNENWDIESNIDSDLNSYDDYLGSETDRKIDNVESLKVRLN